MTNYCSERKGGKMPKIYHIKTLLWTYLVWTALNLLIAFWFCDIAKCSLTNIPYYWGVLHIVPLSLFLPSDIGAFGIVPYACVLLCVLVFVAGLLIKERWARFLIIIGMSLWFFGAFCLIGMGV